MPGKGAIPRKARQQKSDAKIPNEKLNMEVTLEPLSGTVKDNLERAKVEITRVLDFRKRIQSLMLIGQKNTHDLKISR
jgi:hypothetical protein